MAARRFGGEQNPAYDLPRREFFFYIQEAFYDRNLRPERDNLRRFPAGGGN